MEDLSLLPPAPLTVAAGQAPCASLDIPANVAVAARLVRQAAEAGADLLVLPELFLTGYELAAVVARSRTLTLTAADPRLDPLAAVCARTRTAVAVGAPTRDPRSGAVRISALVLGRDGRFAAQYDKQHPTRLERAAGIVPGTAGCTLVLDGWRLGLAICADVRYPEHARAAALDGCHAYLVGSMLDRDDGQHKRASLFPARALDNTSYTLLANHDSPSGPYVGCGRSAVWNPDGTLLAEASGALAVAVLDPAVLARVRAEEPMLADLSLEEAPRTTTFLS